MHLIGDQKLCRPRSRPGRQLDADLAAAYRRNVLEGYHFIKFRSQLVPLLF